MRLARADALARSCGHFLICVGSIFQCKYHWTGGWWGPCGLFTVKVATKIDRPETLLIPSGRSSSSFWLFPLWTAASYYCSHQRCLTQVRRGFLLVRPPFVLCALFLGCTGGGQQCGSGQNMLPALGMLSFAYWLDTCYSHLTGWGSSLLPEGCPDLFSLSLAEAGGSDATYHWWHYCARYGLI